MWQRLCSRLFTEKGFLVAGFDTSVTGIEQARIAHPEAKFEVMSVYEDIGMYFGNDWDVIISCEVIEHLYDPDVLYLI